ncbi:nuclear transport factor 2 family protein [Thalassotalea fusca]
MTKYIALIFLTLMASSVGAHEPSDKVLDAFHQAASEADFTRYFSLMDDNATFLGTDAGERWTKSEFAEYVQPYFSKGIGWTYKPLSRNYTIVDPEGVVVFDEILINDAYGTCRGSGVLKKGDNGWVIVQYNLSVPIPNDIAKKVVQQIRNFQLSNVAEQ